MAQRTPDLRNRRGFLRLDNRIQDHDLRLSEIYSLARRSKGALQSTVETGNLIDNACKWAKGAVAVTARRSGDGEIAVIVDDDGPGLTKAERERAVKRGQRLDESKPGSGLGLSIVADLAHLYKGRFELEKGPKGGLRARLTLPAA